jgi:hypothetical protein
MIRAENLPCKRLVEKKPCIKNSVEEHSRHKLSSTRLLPTPHKLEAYFMRLAPKVLKAVGLYNFARRFYHWIR